MSELTISAGIAALNSAYPEHLASSWDSVGLVIGSPERELACIFLTVDVTQVIVDQAIAVGASLIVAHHPLLLRGISTIAETTHKGAIVSQLMRHNIALYTAHTNADAAWPGVSDALAQCIGLEVVPEVAIEVETGIGRVGELSMSVTAEQFVKAIEQALPHSPSPVLLAGDPEKLIKRVAVCGGAGDSLLEQVAHFDVDAFVTSDLRHHVVSEFIAAHDCAIINIAHWVGEWPWLNQAAEVIRSAFGDKVKVIVSDLPTDPWTRSISRS